jgi:DNA polymerase-3 subunit delta'
VSAVPLLVPDDGSLPLPWLAAPLAQALASQRGHALLVHGASGVGALPFALTLAQAWLCEARPPGGTRPCGRCGSCRLLQSKLHPDLVVLLPENLRRLHEWPLRDDKPEGDDAKRKPSRQIRIDEVRGLIDWAHKTTARGQGKVVVLHPAEALNAQSANALLKTLEEPPAGTRLILTTADPALLLPTVRSRCQHLRLAAPAAPEGLAWLAARGVVRPEVLWAASGGRPLDALALAAAGIDAAAWAALPQAVARGQAGPMSGWPVPQVVDALQKLCVDALAQATGAAPRYFPAGSLPAGVPAAAALLDWSAELARVARHDEHPWNENLLLDALVAGGRVALSTKRDHPAAVSGRFRGGGLDTLPA